MFNRKLFVFLLALFSVLSFIACNDNAKTNEVVIHTTAPETEAVTPEITLEATQKPTEAPTPTPAPTPYVDYNSAGKPIVHLPGVADERSPYEYSFQPHAFSGIYKVAYGDQVEEEILGFCDAVLAGEDSFPCSGRENWIRIDHIKNDLLPVCIYVSLYDPQVQVGDLYFESLRENGRYPLYYKLPKEEFLSVVEEFKQRVTELITQADLREGDSDLEKALKLYTSSSLRLSYVDIGPFSCYRALMGDSGICQEIAAAYAYLLLQVGVDAGICGSHSLDGSTAHMWTLVKLNDQWYHADVTCQLPDPYGLRYFLTDDAERYFCGWDLQLMNIGETYVLWHRDFPIDDNSYADFWNICWYTIDHDAQRIEYYDDPNLDYHDPATYLAERKTLPLR